MNWINPFWTELRAIVSGAWPEISQTYRASQIKRLHFLNEMDAGAIQLPIVVFHIPDGAPRESGYAAGAVNYRPRVTAYYVADQSGKNLADYLEGRLSILQDILLGYQFSTFQITDEADFMIDVSENNMLNQTITQGNLQIFSGALSFSPLIGYIP